MIFKLKAERHGPMDLLFVIVVEILAIKIRNNPNIHGFKLRNQSKEITLAQYADDTSLALYDMESMSAAIDEINAFSEVARPRLNLAKTVGINAHSLNQTSCIK